MDNLHSNALVLRHMCPMYKQGIPFMWYGKYSTGDYIYEYDDRELELGFLDKFRNSYKNWLAWAQQMYYRREIKFLDNLKRIGLEIVDGIVMAINPQSGVSIRENKFQELELNRVVEFGLIGNGGRIFFNTKDGIIHLDGNRDLNVFFYHNGKKINITNNDSATSQNPFPYQNIVERHEMAYEFDLSKPGLQSSAGSLTGWTIGYKGRAESDSCKFEYELAYTLPIGQANYITLTILALDEEATIDLHLTYSANDDNNVVTLPKGETQQFIIRF